MSLYLIEWKIKKEQRSVKVPKLTRDFLPCQMEIRERAFDRIGGVFKKNGAVKIETPFFKLKEILIGK